MIDFRYHLVSLISVFMALAVGIVLGAGPLKESIGDALTGEVEDLRSRSAELRTQLDQTSAELQRTEQGLVEVAPSLLAGTLVDHRVAVVVLGDVATEVTDAVVQRLGETGATVTAQVQVTDLWTDPGQQSFRSALASTLLDHMDPVPAEDAGAGAELAEGLVQGLTTADPAAPDELTDRAGTLLALLTEAELVEVTSPVTTAADHVVLVTAPALSTSEAHRTQQSMASADAAEQRRAAEEAELRASAGLEVARAAGARADGVVVAGGLLDGQGVVAAVRQDEDLVVTTVDNVGSILGQVGTPLALLADVSGTPGHFGTGPGAETVLAPRVVVAPIERVPVVPPADDEAEGGAEGGDAADGAATDEGGTDEGADDAATDEG